jgi:RNA polymerase sigma factor (sigma-70 family)
MSIAGAAYSSSFDRMNTEEGREAANENRTIWFPLSDPKSARSLEAAFAAARARAFEQVILPHLEAAQKLARRLTGDPVLAQDVIQDACARALQHLGSLRGESGRPWFLRIVRNAAYTQMKKSRAGREVALDDVCQADDRGELAMDFVDPDPGPETRLMMSDSSARLDAAIASLPPVLRQCLVLRYKEERSYKEIAQMVSAPIGTVMSRLHRARGKLVEGPDADVAAFAEAR